MVRIFANPLIVYTLYTHHIYVFLSCGTLLFYFKCAGDVRYVHRPIRVLNEDY